MGRLEPEDVEDASGAEERSSAAATDVAADAFAVASIAVAAVLGAGEVPLATGLAIAAAVTVLLVWTIDIGRQYILAYPTGVFSSVAFLIWGPGAVPWAMLGAVASFALQFGAWRRGWLVPDGRTRFEAGEGGVPGEHPSAARFVATGCRAMADWSAGMVVALLAYRALGGGFPADLSTWSSLVPALVFLLLVNGFWLVASEVRAASVRRRQQEEPHPGESRLFARTLLGVYLPLPGTVLVLFTVDQFESKGIAALLLWTAATIPFHLGLRRFLLAIAAERVGERDRARHRAAAMLGSRASMILHEILHQVGTLNLLLRSTAPGDAPARLDAARAVLAELEEIVEHFRVTLRREEPHREAVALAALVAEAVEGEASPERVHLRVAEDAAGESLVADPSLLRPAIANVLRNALEASPADEPVAVGVTCEAGALVVEIVDRGPGFPREPAEGLPPARRGLGLGLHLAREIVAMHGGVLETGEAPGGGGARVRLRFPARSGS